jgi:hypothetical protein
MRRSPDSNSAVCVAPAVTYPARADGLAELLALVAAPFIALGYHAAITLLRLTRGKS